VTKTLTSKATWIVGFAFYSATSVQDATHPMLQFVDTATTHVWCGHDGSGRIQFRLGSSGGTVLGTTTTTMSPATWYYLEIKVTIADAGGVCACRVNGIQEVNFSGDTRNGANASANILSFTGQNTSAISRFDDLYACDGDAPSPYNDYLGDCRVEALFPNGNGTTSGMTGSDGNSTDNYLLVDETSPDDDTTYVQSNVVATKDTYNYGSLAVSSGTVYAVQLLPWAKKTDAGTRTFVTVARTSGGTEEDSSAVSLTTTYTYQTQNIRTTKPGGGAWDITEVNGAEFGIKVDT
jgi:hypothetical protein